MLLDKHQKTLSRSVFLFPTKLGCKLDCEMKTMSPQVQQLKTVFNFYQLVLQQAASPQCGADMYPGGDECPSAIKWGNGAPTLWLLLLLATELTVYSYNDSALSLSSFLLTARAAAAASTPACSFTLFGWKMELSEVMWLNSQAVRLRFAPVGPVLRGTAGLLLEVCLLLWPSHQCSSGGSLKITKLFGKDEGGGGPSCGLGNLFRSFIVGL